MKKFLLTLIVTMLTCLGAWAEPTSWGTDNKGSWEVDGTTLTVTFASQADWNGLGWGAEPWASSESGLTTVVLKFTDDFDASTTPSSDNFYHFTQKISSVTTLDLSALGADFFVQNVLEDLNNSKHFTVKNIEVPSGLSYNSSEDPWKNYTISGGTDLNTGGGTPGGGSTDPELPGYTYTVNGNFVTFTSSKAGDFSAFMATLSASTTPNRYGSYDWIISGPVNASDLSQDSFWPKTMDLSAATGYTPGNPKINTEMLVLPVGSEMPADMSTVVDGPNGNGTFVVVIPSSDNSTLQVYSSKEGAVDAVKNYDYIQNHANYGTVTATGALNDADRTALGISSGDPGEEPGGEEGPGDDPKGREVNFDPTYDDVSVAIGTPYQFNMSTTGYTGNNMSVATCTVTKNGEVCDANIFEVRYANGQTLANVRHSQITTILEPKSVGDYVVTFYLSDYDATWNKDGAAVTKSITVHAYDPTIATSFTVSPTSPTVDMGDKTTVNVNLFPATAGLTKSDVTIVSGLGTKVNDAEDILKVTLADDKSSIEIDATNAASTGTATFTLTPNGLDPVTVTVTVVNPRVKATASCPASVRMGETTLSASATLGDDLYSDDYTISYSSDDDDILKVNAETGALTPVSVGTAKITVTVAPKDADATLDPFTQAFDVEVKKGELALALSASPAALQGGKVGSSTISHTVTLNGDKPTTTGYSISDYTLVSAPEGVNLADGVVSVPATVSSGEIKVQATITPTDDAYECTTATAEAVIKIVNDGVVLSKETIDGKEYVVVNVINAGAFGTNISNNPAVINAGASLNDLKNAANVKVVGSLKNSDVQELVNLIGGTIHNAAIPEGKCKTLDMGEARMVEAITTINVGTESEPTYKCSLVGGRDEYGNVCDKSLTSVETLVLPLPATATDVENGTVLPRRMNGLTGGWFNHAYNHLQSLTIPDGWTEVAAEAWADAQSTHSLGGTGSGLMNLNELKLPDSIEKIDDFAFSCLGVKTLTMPKNITYIGAGAFNTSPKLSDIYFTGDGTALKYVDIDAFSVQTQMVNDCVEADNDCNDKNMPTMNRSHYVNGGVLACILHFPEGCDAEYTDITRKYTVIDTSVQTYQKGNILSSYIPDGWTEQFLSDVDAASVNQDVKVITANKCMVSGGFPDDTFGYNMVWPSQYQMTSGYAIANAGYLWNGQHMSEAQLSSDGTVDKRGLYQFIVSMSNAPKSQDEWPFKYEQDKWYTICLPFNMSVDEIRKVFGVNTQVCRFDKVVRVETATEANNNTKKIYLEFRKDVLTSGGYANSDKIPVTTRETGEKDSKGNPILEDVYADNTTTGIVHHVAYMIKPSGTVSNDPSVKFNSSTGERVFSGYKTIPGVLYKDKVKSEGGAERTYDFRGVTMKSDIVANTYVLSNKGENDKHIFGFYKGTLKNGVYVDGGTWNAYTAAVFPENGVEEYETFFGPNAASASNAAPVYTFYIDDEEPTGIEAYEIVCGNDPITDGKIYTVSGQRVNGINLTPGIYIKNGKKFIVK